MGDRVDEESEKKSDALKALSKANAEIQLWKSKMETEAAGRIDELEMGKTKLNSALSVAEVDASNKECRNFNSDLFRVKAGLDETTQQLDIVKRENKNLADEIKDLLDQLGDGGRSIHELDKQRRRLEVEKEELQ